MMMPSPKTDSSKRRLLHVGAANALSALIWSRTKQQRQNIIFANLLSTSLFTMIFHTNDQGGTLEISMVIYKV